MMYKYGVCINGWCTRLTAVAICASLGVNLQAWRKRVLQEVHVEVILTLHRFLYAQLEDVGEVAGGIKPKIHYRIPNAEREYKREKIVRICDKNTSWLNRFLLLMLKALFIDFHLHLMNRLSSHT